jgi:hypothetical protein
MGGKNMSPYLGIVLYEGRLDEQCEQLKQVMAEGRQSTGNLRGGFSPLRILTSMDLARCMLFLFLKATKYSIGFL